MSDEIVSMFVVAIRAWLAEKHGEYQASVDGIDRMTPANEAELKYAMSQRKWRKWAMAGLKKAYSDCTANTIRKRLVQWGFIDEHALQNATTANPARDILPFPTERAEHPA